MDDELIGRRLSHYRVLAKAGAGGMGVVFRAYDEKLRRDVALKTLPTGRVADEVARRRVREEALILSRLSHPGIETVYDFDTQDGIDFLVMEYLEGRTLADQIAGRPLDDRDLITLGGQIAEALHAAHRRHVIHLDLKPSNILITDEGHTKILDFGISKVVAPVDDTSTTETVTDATRIPKGTLPYMSPEQLRARQVDARTDIHALGVVLYEMATGQRPFRRPSATALIEQICHEPAQPPGAISPKVPPEIERVILKCLEKDPGSRYQSAIEVKVDLERAGRASPPTQAGRPQGRWWRRAAAWAGAAIGIGVAAWLAAPLWLPFLEQALERFRPVPMISEGRQVTFSGHAWASALSPDGRYMAYVLAAEPFGARTQKVVVQDFATGNTPHEIFEGRDIASLRWNPDGTILACSGFTEDRGWGIYLVPRFGGDASLIPVSAAGTTWRGDGAAIAAWRMAQRELWIYDLATRDSVAVPLPASILWVKGADWSRDGSRFAVSTVDDHQVNAIWTLRTDGRDWRLLVRDSLELRSPSWSRGGDAVFFIRGSEPVADLCRIPVSRRTGAATGEIATILPDRNFGSDFSLSRDDSRLLYSAQQARSNLWLLDIEGGGRSGSFRARRLTEGTFQDEDPSFSPEGGQIAFTRREGDKANIHVLDLDSGAIRQITFLRSASTQPVWSPTGRVIAFGSSEGGAGQRVWLVSPSGGAPRPCSSVPVSQDIWTRCWSPGTKIAAAKPGNQDYVLLDPVTGEAEPLDLGPDGEWRFTPAFSPDGTKLAYFANSRSGGKIQTIDLSSGKRHVVTDGARASIVGWAPDGRSIYYLDYQRSPIELRAVPASGGSARLLGPIELPGRQVGCSVSHDARHAVVACDEMESDLWLIETAPAKRAANEGAR